MRAKSYAEIDALRDDFRALVDRWTREHPYLSELQEKLRRSLGYDDYRVETSIVYNRALDDIVPEDEIRIVLVADNPGKNEQLAKNNRYLVGQSGKLAEGWFRRELGVDFRREVMVLNKTPVHTPKTAELRKLVALAGPDRQALEALLAESQRAMADIAWRARAALGATLWISGVGELRDGGLFQIYRDALADLIAARPAQRGKTNRAGGSVWAFNHFSMNQFAIELARKTRPGAPLRRELARIGTENRLRVLGV
jgi:hypothetical protein